jgi:hypothetical protein
MKKGKELKVNSFKNYNVYYGSVNNKEPKALYINISAWAEPEEDDNINYSRVVRDLDKKIRQSIYQELEENYPIFLRERTIVDFDIRESGIKYGKRSFTNCEITLFMKYELPINSEDMKSILDDLIKVIIEDTLEKSKHFKFHKKKK